MLRALAFVPVAEALSANDYMWGARPKDAEELLSFFDATKGTGFFRPILEPAAYPAADTDAMPPPMRLRNVASQYPTPAWNQCDATLKEEARTNN